MVQRVRMGEDQISGKEERILRNCMCLITQSREGFPLEFLVFHFTRGVDMRTSDKWSDGSWANSMKFEEPGEEHSITVKGGIGPRGLGELVCIGLF